MGVERTEGIILDKAEAELIKNWGERVFATACLGKGLIVRHQVSVGASTIDFQVVNPKIGGSGTLVEVTGKSNGQLQRSERKRRQKENMEKIGTPNTILNRPHLIRIRKNNLG